MTYKAGVVGAAGFAGIELVRLLARHPEFELVAATSDALAGTPIAKALLGKKKGECVDVTVPAGTIKFEILDINI